MFALFLERRPDHPFIGNGRRLFWLRLIWSDSVMLQARFIGPERETVKSLRDNMVEALFLRSQDGCGKGTATNG